ncbi:MAG: hypothetical protein NTV74_03665 [Euryarchaeota archaeon]|nr:hypothetical protein [Euryarchaeota archaeon]
MKKTIGKSIRFIIYVILFFFIAIIATYLVMKTHRYDGGLVAMISFLFIGIPFFIGGIIVMAILLKKRVQLHYEIIAVIIIAILMVFSFSFLIHRNGLPEEPWEYNEELSKLYKLSLFGINEFDDYRVYLGKTTIQGREAAIYRYEQGWDEWYLIDTGIEKDGKLFVDNWRVYPTGFVGTSHLGGNPIGTGQAIYVDNLTNMADTYTIYLKNNTGDFISNLSSYNATAGDIIAVFGEWKNGPAGSCEDCDYLIVDKIEVVEFLS